MPCRSRPDGATIGRRRKRANGRAGAPVPQAQSLQLSTSLHQSQEAASHFTCLSCSSCMRDSKPVAKRPLWHLSPSRFKRPSTCSTPLTVPKQWPPLSSNIPQVCTYVLMYPPQPAPEDPPATATRPRKINATASSHVDGSPASQQLLESPPRPLVGQLHRPLSRPCPSAPAVVRLGSAALQMSRSPLRRAGTGSVPLSPCPPSPPPARLHFHAHSPPPTDQDTAAGRAPSTRHETGERC